MKEEKGPTDSLALSSIVSTLIISSLDHSKSLSNWSTVLSVIPASFLQTTIAFSLTHYLMSFPQVKLSDCSLSCIE